MSFYYYKRDSCSSIHVYLFYIRYPTVKVVGQHSVFSTVFSVSISWGRVGLMIVFTPLPHYEKPFSNCSPLALVVSLVAVPVNPPLFLSVDHVAIVLGVYQHGVTVLGSGKSGFFYHG